jgi:hypothetical protein
VGFEVKAYNGEKKEDKEEHNAQQNTEKKRLSKTNQKGFSKKGGGHK